MFVFGFISSFAIEFALVSDLIISAWANWFAIDSFNANISFLFFLLILKIIRKTLYVAKNKKENISLIKLLLFVLSKKSINMLREENKIFFLYVIFKLLGTITSSFSWKSLMDIVAPFLFGDFPSKKSQDTS